LEERIHPIILPIEGGTIQLSSAVPFCGVVFERRRHKRNVNKQMLDRFKFKNILSFSAYLEGTSVAYALKINKY
jgi:hypothetical protein